MGNLGVGSGPFPTVTGFGMVVFGLVLAAGALLARRGGGEAVASGAPPVRGDALVTLALLAGVVVLMPSLGFIVVGAVFAAAAARLGGAGLAGAAIFGIAATLGLYAVFVHALGVPLPRGLLGF